MLDQFEFRHPAVLGLLALLPLYALLLGRYGRAAAMRFPSAELARAAGAKARSAPGRLMISLRMAALALLIVACSGPRLTRTHIERHAEGIDIVLAVDLSASMLALDLAPEGRDLTRIEVARKVIREFIEKRPDDRIGMVAFSGKPYLVSPLTTTHPWLLKRLDALRAGTIKEIGTALGDALAMSTDRMKTREGKGSRVIILLTDGDDNMSREIMPLSTCELVRALGHRLYTIGIGKDEATTLPKVDLVTGKPKRGPDGKVIYSDLVLPPANYELLGKMAALGQGRFYRAKNAEELGKIYDDIGKLEKSDVHVTTRTEYIELFTFLVLGALAALLTEFILAHTRFLRLP